ncbi:hypothetical protein CGC49_04455 [Capnocytophaga sp. H4358]|nr:hypothetical protein CGC49_04455 [Capnocytophaga sp. H4358]
MFITFLLLNIFVSYFVVRNKEKKEVRHNLIWINAPILGLLLITSFFTDGIRVVIPYLIFSILGAVLLYYYVTSPSKKVAFFVAGLVLIAVGVFSFESISGVSDTFDGSYYLDLYKKFVNK